MYRHLPLLALTLVLGVAGCERQRDDTPQPPEPGDTPGETMEQPVTPPNGGTPDNGGTTMDDMDSGNSMNNGNSMNDGSSIDDGTANTQLCTPEWFAQVHEQIQSLPDSHIAQHLPGGLPDVGSSDWFSAVEKLTGATGSTAGSGAQGSGNPAGGTPEWCRMIQQRLSQSR